nr:efflux RND transporter permease subunit [Paraburkholderia hospita]
MTREMAVVLVVILFLQTWRASIIPLIAAPVSIVGTIACPVHVDCLRAALPRSGRAAVNGDGRRLLRHAMCESFFGTLEAELLDREHFGTHEQARHRIFWYLERWYNLRRLHSSLRYRSPLEFEQLHAHTQTSSQRGLPTDGQRHGRERRPAALPWTTRSSTLNGG